MSRERRDRMKIIQATPEDTQSKRFHSTGMRTPGRWQPAKRPKRLSGKAERHIRITSRSYTFSVTDQVPQFARSWLGNTQARGPQQEPDDPHREHQRCPHCITPPSGATCAPEPEPDSREVQANRRFPGQHLRADRQASPPGNSLILQSSYPVSPKMTGPA